MKKSLSFILSLIMILSAITSLPFTVQADELTSGSCGENVTYTFSSATGALTISGSGAMTSFGFSDSPFYYNGSINSVIINSGVTSIGSRTFNFCIGLTRITIPNSVTSIGHDAFYSCKSLTSITIPNSVTSIGKDAFGCCIELASITVSEGNSKYDSRNNCNAIIETSKNKLISGCKNTVIPNGVTSIDEWAFGDCTSLTSIEIPDSVKSIGMNAFYGCTNLSDVYYYGSEAEWNAISIGSSNSPLTNAVIHYNYIGHEHDYTAVITAPTCTEKGCTTYTCTICGDKYTDNETAALGHTWGDWTLKEDAVAPTCTKTGTTTVETRACSNCGFTESRGGYTIMATGHNVAIDAAVEETCTSDGKTEGKHCTVCGEIIVAQQVVPARHIEAIDEAVPATCTTSGKTEGTHCSRCDAVIVAQEFVAPLGHNYVKDVVPPNCTDKGYTIYACSRCRISYVADYVNSTGEHVWDGGVTAKTATCTENGSVTYSCRICHTTKTEELKALGHVPTVQTTPAKPNMNGSVVTSCVNCNVELSRKAIYCPQTVTLSSTKYTYDGKAKTPSVKVTDSNGKVIPFANYSVTYPSGRKAVGTYSVKIDFNGNYSGSMTKTFDIVPKPTKLKSVKTPDKEMISIIWSKVAGVTGYDVQLATDKKFKKGVKNYVAPSKYTAGNIKNLKGGKTYYIRVRTYKTVKYGGKSKKLCSAWSKAKSIKTKK